MGYHPHTEIRFLEDFVVYVISGRLPIARQVSFVWCNFRDLCDGSHDFRVGEGRSVGLDGVCKGLYGQNGQN